MTPTTPRPWLLLALALLGGVLFSAAYCHAPLYYSNQNQYFLHGSARAGVGTLDEDWLANTRDPTPAFSRLVEAITRTLPVSTFHVVHGVLLAVYAGALVALFFRLGGPDVRRRWPVFVALLFLTHAGVMRLLSYRLFGFDYVWFFQAGVAGQYVLGAMLQPSAFGVLLVASVALFAFDRPYAAAVVLGVGAAMHATYLLPGAFLIVGYQATLLREKRLRAALLVGLIALVLVSPSVAYAFVQFRPTSSDTFAESQATLAHFRIPHHARPDLWIDWVAGVQIAWILAALACLYQTRLFVALGVPFALAVVFTLIQVFTGNDTLALLFPWRLSAILMPVSTAIILTKLVAIPALPLSHRLAWLAAFVVIVKLSLLGVAIMLTRSAFRSDDVELGVLAHVRETRRPGELYFIPVEVPNLAAKTRGSLSSDFKPLAAKKLDAKVIPIGLQRFRLHAQAPIYVDFKSIPYKDVEVVEWRERLDAADAVCKKIKAEQTREAVGELRRLGATHLVWPASQPLHDAGLRETFADEGYRVYRLMGE